MQDKTFQFRKSIADTSLAEMFANIYRHKVPGLIEISREEACKRIYIYEGNVIHATSTDRPDRLGAYLYRIGKLDRKQLVDTMRDRAKAGIRHGELLIEQKLLSPGELFEAIRGQMEEIVWSVFSWQEGEVSFKIGNFSDPRMIKIHLPMQQVIVRGIKKAADTKALVARLGKKRTVFIPTYCTEDLIEIALNRDEYRLLCLADGHKNLYEICSEGPLSVSENARLLYAFRVLGLIKPSSDHEDGDASGVKIRL